MLFLPCVDFIEETEQSLSILPHICHEESIFAKVMHVLPFFWDHFGPAIFGHLRPRIHRRDGASGYGKLALPKFLSAVVFVRPVRACLCADASYATCNVPPPSHHCDLSGRIPAVCYQNRWPPLAPCSPTPTYPQVRNTAEVADQSTIKLLPSILAGLVS